MINAQNNHILELLKIALSFYIKELTKIDFNADGGNLIANAVLLS
jgi:hypothetical protein